MAVSLSIKVHDETNKSTNSNDGNNCRAVYFFCTVDIWDDFLLQVCWFQSERRTAGSSGTESGGGCDKNNLHAGDSMYDGKFTPECLLFGCDEDECVTHIGIWACRGLLL